MGDRRRRSLALQMAQYQASLAIGDAKMNNKEAKCANSLMKYEHHAEFSYRGFVTGHSFPNHEDLKMLLCKTNKRGFPGMIRSFDYMHWEWKNCRTAWADQFKGIHNKPTSVLKVVASYNTWIWHAFFGTSGSNNDIKVL
ncbi:unnamed protein product [Malus baccata var. baccata]